MDQLDAMRVYVAVVESQGFSAASRALGIPVPTVCRKVANLEERLGVQLLVRSTRKVSATSSGMHYYDDAKRILEDVSGANRRVAGEYRQIKGLLTITAPALFGRLHILPIVNDFMRLHDEVEVRLLLTNHMLDMLEEHIDLGVTIGSRSRGSIEIIPVTEMRLIVCASPKYLSAAGRPGKPDDLLDHKTITFAKSCMQDPWPFKMLTGDTREINLKSRLVVNTAEAAVDSALQDTGLTQLYYYQAKTHITAGELEVVLESYEIEPDPVVIAIPQGPRTPQKVSAFVDFAITELRKHLW
jgi:DNA-binding transcriptional LysR family regulator